MIRCYRAAASLATWPAPGTKTKTFDRGIVNWKDVRYGSGKTFLAPGDMSMPGYCFVIRFPRECAAVAFTGDCCDDDDARILARATIADPNGRVEVWTGGRFVEVVHAATDLRQAPAALTSIEEWRDAVAAAGHPTYVPHAPAIRARARLEAFDGNNWLLLIVSVLAALAALSLISGP